MEGSANGPKNPHFFEWRCTRSRQRTLSHDAPLHDCVSVCLPKAEAAARAKKSRHPNSAPKMPIGIRGGQLLFGKTEHAACQFGWPFKSVKNPRWAPENGVRAPSRPRRASAWALLPNKRAPKLGNWVAGVASLLGRCRLCNGTAHASERRLRDSRRRGPRPACKGPLTSWRWTWIWIGVNAETDGLYTVSRSLRQAPGETASRLGVPGRSGA